MHINAKWLRLKAERRELATQRTGWNRYSIHDRETVKKRLAVQHKAKQDVAAKLGQPIPTDRDFAVAVFQNEARYRRHRGDTGTYLPHQGARECTRRHVQAAR